MNIYMAGSRPPGDPTAIERLAATIRREARLQAVDIADVGSWRGYGADQATSRIKVARTGLANVVSDLLALATTLDRMADDLKDDQRAWDKSQEARNAANS